MNALLNFVQEHKSGKGGGIYSVCSANPTVLEAAFAEAAERNLPFALVEATSNQVNQDRGYTGMTPADFRDFALELANKAGLASERVLLGGDHLGPNTWQNESPENAMAKAEVLIASYVEAGFRKIHLDCSMSCLGDPIPLSDETVATRASRLARIAEDTYEQVGGEPPVYVIGTEVPVPGGAQEALDELAVTTPEAAIETINVHQKIFEDAGLTDAWKRVIATVTQPGVEFDHHHVIDYQPAKAKELSLSLAEYPQLVFEAHSTDYQTDDALASLVRDHFAILKVGPGLTFALREAYWALDAIEKDWLGDKASGFREVVLKVMKGEPHYWEKYYESKGTELNLDLQYSLSDRIRYYWPHPEIKAALVKMLSNLSAEDIPLPLISMYFPGLYQAVRSGEIQPNPDELTKAHIRKVIASYAEACSAPGE